MRQCLPAGFLFLRVARPDSRLREPLRRDCHQHPPHFPSPGSARSGAVKLLRSMARASAPTRLPKRENISFDCGYSQGSSACDPAVACALFSRAFFVAFPFRERLGGEFIFPTQQLSVPVDHSTISAVSTTAWKRTSAPAPAHSLEISSASLCDNPSTHGQNTMAVGASRLIQQASCPAPETISR